MVDPLHARKLCDAYKGDKKYILTKGTHNTDRDRTVTDAQVRHLLRNLRFQSRDNSQSRNSSADSKESRYPQTVTSREEYFEGPTKA